MLFEIATVDNILDEIPNYIDVFFKHVFGHMNAAKKDKINRAYHKMARLHDHDAQSQLVSKLTTKCPSHFTNSTYFL